MKFYTTIERKDRQKPFQYEIKWKEDVDEVENEVINIYPEMKYQTFEGFGGAITDAAGFVYSLMPEQEKKRLMQTYFSPDQMKYGKVRVHIDSCDFSTEMYEAMSDNKDEKLESFSFDRTEKYIIPMLEDAQKMAGKPLKLMLSPWSPPAFMKTNGSRKNGGKLKPEYRKLWAEYLCRYIIEFQKRDFYVERISIQNEAKAVQTWDSCVYSAEEEKIFLRDYLYPALQKNGLENVKVFIWDHNKERIFERTKEIMDDTTKDMVDGVAFHWYSGDHFEALALVKEKYPNLKLIISESCIEYTKYHSENHIEQAKKLSHEIIGDLNHGMCAFYDWNILLDETGGPNHVGNYCHAPFLYDTKKKILMPQLLQQYFAHFSTFIEAGAKRIGFSKFTEKIDVTAFENQDKSIVVVLLNKTDKDISVVLRCENKIIEILLPANSITTGIDRERREVKNG